MTIGGVIGSVIRSTINPVIGNAGGGEVAQPLLLATMNNSLSRGVETQNTDRAAYRWRHVVGADLDSIAAVFLAHGHDTNSAAYTIEDASIQLPDNTVVPLTFNGSRSLAVAAGATDVRSDEIDLVALNKQLTRGQLIWIKFKVSLAAGGTLPISNKFTFTLTGLQALWYNAANTTLSSTDASGAYTVTGTAAISRNNGLDPIIVGRRTDTPANNAIPSLFAIGDSITIGFVDSNSITGALPRPSALHDGFIPRAVFGGAAANAIPSLIYGNGSFTALDFINLAKWDAYLKYATVGLDSLLTNETTQTIGTLQQRAQTIWARMKAGGISKVIRKDLWARATSSDNWATLANQTVNTAFASSKINDLAEFFAEQVAANPNLDYFVPTTHVINKSVDGVARRWNVDGTANFMAADDVHPAGQGHLATAIALRKLINVEFLGAANEVPQRPTAPFITAGANQLTELIVRMEATYKGSSDITGYEIQYRTSPSGSFTQVTGSWSNPAILDKLDVPITGLTGGTAYDVQYRLINSVGNSEWSSFTVESTEAAYETLLDIPYARIDIDNKNPAQNDVITYALEIENEILFPFDVDITTEGDLTDSDFNTPFLTALGAAVTATAGVSLSGNTLTFTPDFPQTAGVGVLEWSRTLTKNSTEPDAHAVKLVEENYTLCRATLPYVSCISGPIPMQEAVPYTRGVNISGAEGQGANDDSFPLGLYRNAAFMDFFLDLGFGNIRYPHKMERFTQDGLNTALTDGPQLQRYRENVQHITETKNKYAIIDPHNYASYNSNKIGLSTNFRALDLGDYWLRLMAYLGDNQKIIVNIMNEPHGSSLPAKLWADASKTVVSMLRANKHWNMIQIPGTFFSKADDFPTRDGIFWGGWADPADVADPSGRRWMFEVHQYFDSNESGTSGVCALGKESNLAGIFAWAIENNYRVHLGEFGLNQSANCLSVADGVFGTYLNADGTPFNGYSAWGGGFPTSYFFYIGLIDGVDSEFLAILKEQLALPAPRMNGVTPIPQTISGLQLWLDATDATTISVTGSDVTQWNDKSGNGNHAVQSVGANRFQTGLDTLNGLNVLTNTGTNVNMLLPSALHTISNGNSTCIMVAKLTGTNGRVFLRGRQTISPSAIRYLLESRDNATTLQARNLGSGGLFATTNHGQTWQMFGLRRNGATLDALYSTGIVASDNTASSFTMEDLAIGYGVDLAEVIIYAGAPTNAEIAALQTYIQTKYDVTQILVT